MADVAWTLKSGSTTQNFEAWGLSRPVRTRVSQAVDTVTFEHATADFDDTPLFAPKSVLEIFRDGVRWFYGRVGPVPREGGAKRERMSYVVEGPWTWLDRIVFQQEWRYIPSSLSSVENVNKTRVILGQELGTVDGTWARFDVAEQIGEILDWAINCGAPITKGTIDAPADFVMSEGVSLSCAEAIRRVMRWQPDAAIYWDYTTTPYPTIHVMRRGTATALQLTVGGGVLSEIPTLTGREDLQLPGVAFLFEKTHQIDNTTVQTVEVDKYPTDLDLDAPPLDTLVQTIELSGYRGTSQRQELDAAAINTGSVSWWQTFYPELPDDATIVNSATAAVYSGDPSSWPNYVVSGAVPEWLQDNHAGELRCWARVSYSIEDDDGRVLEYKSEELGVQVMGTDLAGRTYSRPSSETQAEATPTGLAEAFYNAMAELHWEGDVVCQQDDVGLAVATGYVVQILGSDVTAWATMKAQVQRVVEDVETGRTSIRIGPPKQLSPQDLVELFRLHRAEPATSRLNERNNGQPGADRAMLGTGAAPVKNATKSGGPVRRLVLVSDDGNTTITIDPNADGIKVENGSDVAWLKFNEITVNDGSNTATIEADQVSVSDGNDTSNMTPTQVGVTDGAGNNAGMTKDALGIEAATGDVATLTPSDLVIDNGTGTGTLSATALEITVPASFTATLEKDNLTIEGGGKYINIDLADLPSSGFAEFEELDYCDAGTAKTLYALSTLPAV